MVPIAAILPLRTCWTDDLCWAPWGKTMWRFHRAWCTARITSEIPVGVWGVPAERVPRICPLCRSHTSSLHHLLAECPPAAAWREAALLAWAPQVDLVTWALTDVDCVEQLAAKVRFVGLACAAFVHACSA